MQHKYISLNREKVKQVIIDAVYAKYEKMFGGKDINITGHKTSQWWNNVYDREKGGVVLTISGTTDVEKTDTGVKVIVNYIGIGRAR
jgi:hypothetical protein